MIESLGFIGVGHLADYTIRGLRRGGFEGRIWLSPRNAERAATLSRDCGCEVLESNQAVADATDHVVLSVRPALGLDVLRGIRLRPGQRLISVMAGLPIDKLRPLAGGAQIFRAMPVTSAQASASPTLICPPDDELAALFDYAGAGVCVADEQEFEAGAVMACVYGWFFPLYGRLIADCEAAGVGSEAARKLVFGMAEGAARVAAETPAMTLEEITWEIATEGTFTRLGLEHLLQRDAFKPWSESFEKVLTALRGD